MDDYLKYLESKLQESITMCWYSDIEYYKNKIERVKKNEIK